MQMFHVQGHISVKHQSNINKISCLPIKKSNDQSKFVLVTAFRALSVPIIL